MEDRKIFELKFLVILCLLMMITATIIKDLLGQMLGILLLLSTFQGHFFYKRKDLNLLGKIGFLLSFLASLVLVFFIFKELNLV